MGKDLNGNEEEHVYIAPVIKDIDDYLKEKSGHYIIYFISDSNGHVKIGKTTDLMTRLNTLQTANAYPLDLMYFIECRDKEHMNETEKALHQYFDHCRFMGEWFDEYKVEDFLSVFNVIV